MITIDINKMLESGVQFGHLTSIWNPANKHAIKGVKNNVHIFDLNNTAKELQVALNFVAKMVEDGKDGMIIATRLQARESGEKLAKTANFPAVLTRWVGGTITNFDSIKKRSQYLRELNREFETGGVNKYTKKERVVLNTKRARMARELKGLENLNRKPQFVIVSSALKDMSAIEEAKKNGIKVIAIVDSNADPRLVDYVIHANDDAKASLDYIFELLTQAIVEAKAMKNAPVPA